MNESENKGFQNLCKKYLNTINLLENKLNEEIDLIIFFYTGTYHCCPPEIKTEEIDKDNELFLKKTFNRPNVKILINEEAEKTFLTMCSADFLIGNGFSSFFYQAGFLCEGTKLCSKFVPHIDLMHAIPHIKPLTEDQACLDEEWINLNEEDFSFDINLIK